MAERFLKASVRNIPPYIPGRSRDEVAREYGLDPKNVIKMASNENPLGPPPSAVEAIKAHAHDTAVYPSADASDLRESIARHIGMEKENVIACNGSDEVLDIIIKAFLEKGEEAVIPSPTFSMYRSLVEAGSGRPVHVGFTEGFQYDIGAILGAITPDTKLVFICSPNNPTGQTIDEKVLREVLEEEVVVVVDEAYWEFSGETFAPLVAEYDNLIITRTFSKAFGLAGMRVGYGISNPETINVLLRIKIPFSTNLLAEKAALAALDDQDHFDRTIETVRGGRAFLEDEIGKIKGLSVYPSKANFVLMNTWEAGITSTRLAQELFKKGIITRDCRSFQGLDDYHLRVSVGTEADNTEFIKRLKEIV